MIWPSHYIHINTSGNETTLKKQLKHTKWDKTDYVPHQAHVKKLTHVLRIKTIWEERIFPVINPQKQETKLAVSHPNAREQGWSLGLSCPRGLQKQKAITDGQETDGFPVWAIREATLFLSSEH